MDNDTLKRNLRLVGTICAIILAIIGALGIDVPSIQDSEILSAIATLIAAIAHALSYWFNNNHTLGAKMSQPYIKEINTAVKDEMDSMGRGVEDDE